MDHPPRQLPRFLPTLTEVVESAPEILLDHVVPLPAGGQDGYLPAPAPELEAPPAQPEHVVEAGDATGWHAEAAVPGELQSSMEAAMPFPPQDTASVPQAPVVPTPDWAAIEEQLVQRVLQRVDVALDARVRAVVAEVVEDQTRSLVPRLRDALEGAVRDIVSEALSQDAYFGERDRSFRPT